MANSFLKSDKIVAQALGLLEREIVIPRMVWMFSIGDFKGVANDTISIRVPARTTARTRPLRGNRGTASEGEGIITMDDLIETKVDVTLDTSVYSAVPITDEQMTLDIYDFGFQVLRPQVTAVAEGLENAIVEEMRSATYVHTATIGADPVDAYDGLVDARMKLNKSNVPMSDRHVVVGPGMEARFLKSDHLNRVDQSGTDSALRDATIGKLAGFDSIVVSNALDDDEGYAFHRTAYAIGMVAPQIPAGASFGQMTTGARGGMNGIGALRWLRDYDFRNVQDRSLVDAYIGTNIIADGPKSSEVQTVTITGAPTGGSFTLTFDGQTTAAIAYNATAAAVRTALVALSNIAAGDVTTTGGPLPGTAVTVTFAGNYAGKDVPQMTATGSLTGGTTPAVAVATGTAGGTGANSFVRAVKLSLA